MAQKKHLITENEVNQIVSETTKNMKQFMDEEIEIRVRQEVRKELARMFRDMGRNY